MGGFHQKACYSRAIAVSSPLAGNLTLVGSVANLIVAKRARSAGIECRSVLIVLPGCR
jgi:Na+/H+ antiporter NhaD/arsenite permease-like protein